MDGADWARPKTDWASSGAEVNGFRGVCALPLTIQQAVRAALALFRPSVGELMADFAQSTMAPSA
jgi:hypothetical protein